jgi:DNA-binding SARP family transcriptional activator
LASRIYVTGHIGIEHEGRFAGERQLPGRQGRLAFAYLVLKRAGAVTRDDLAEVLWRDEPPSEADAALSAILSKLRASFKHVQLHDAAIELRGGTVALRLGSETRVDVEDAASAVDQAEGAWRRGNNHEAWSHANVGVVITRRPFLAREEAPWIEAERDRLRLLLSRSLKVLSAVSEANDEAELALHYTRELVELEPFRETGYQQLMRLHARLGNRGEALRVFARLRELLRDELGTNPSPQTEALFREILTA